MTDPRNRIARSAPSVVRRLTRPEIEARVLAKLQREFAVPRLSALPDFLVVLEGATDRGYVERAAQLVEATGGVNPLEVPDTLRRGSEHRVALVVPGESGKPASGGVKRMVDLAASLFADFFAAEVPVGIVFVFDHDWAGREARDRIKRYGFRPDQHSLTLNPAANSTQATSAEVVIEDLIPLTAQESFFDLGGAFCSKEYRDGLLTRMKWDHPSKAALRRHICTHSDLADFSEFLTLLSRIRAAFGFPPLDQPLRSTRATGTPDPSL